MIDLQIRATDYQAWLDSAVAAGVVSGVDPDTGAAMPSSGANIDQIGPVTTTEAVYSEDGLTLVTPAVIDARFHANLRFTGGGVEVGERYALDLTQGAYAGVTLLDPADIDTPDRRWA